MRRSLLCRCLGAGLLGAALAVGCSHGERRCECGEAGPPFPLEGTIPASYRTVVATPARPGPAPAPLAELLPARHTTFARDAGRGEPERPPERLALALAPLEPTADEPPSSARKTHGADRRTFTDLTAHPAFAHAPDYRWLIGVLQHDGNPKVWSVRYASVDENDRHGGTLTLVHPGPMTEFRPGQLVRVEGEVVDPAPHEIRSGYRPRSIRLLLSH